VAVSDKSLFDALIEYSPGEAMDSTSPLTSEGVGGFIRTQGYCCPVLSNGVLTRRAFYLSCGIEAKDFPGEKSRPPAVPSRLNRLVRGFATKENAD